MGEKPHAGLHAVLLVVGLVVLSRLAPRGSDEPTALDTEAEARLERMQKAVDAMAIDVERIGEAQRYANKLASERVNAMRKPEQ